VATAGEIMPNGVSLRRSISLSAVIAALLAAHPLGADAETARPDEASSGGFWVRQIATNNPDDLLADWFHIPTMGVPTNVSTRTVRGRPIVVFLVFKGCRRDRAWKCNVTADFETIGPSGTVDDHTVGAKVWVDLSAPPDNDYQLSRTGYGLVAEDGDAIGTYRVRAAITDHVAGITLHTEQELVVTEK